jgi:lipoic acid synthetase
LLRERGLSTVCDEARCPNRHECWGAGTATFLLMGETCTRGCRFCSVRTATGPLDPPDPGEPGRVVQAARLMGLEHVVLTSVTRDDLPDGGAAHFARVIRAVHEDLPEASVEALIPPLSGERLRSVLDAGVDVLAHNVEVVRRLTPLVRDPRADYAQSLAVLDAVKGIDAAVRTKSSLLLGLGESHEEVLETLDDLRASRVDLVAIGQYLQPTADHAPVVEYVTPERWERIRSAALERGFAHVAAGPFVRTSYRAHEAVARVPLVPYAEGLALQERARERVRAGEAESLMVLSHPPVITLGRQADPAWVTASADRLEKLGIEVVRTSRGGEVTYHGPGQLVVYPIVNLERHRLGGRAYVRLLLEALVETLAGFGVEAHLEQGTVGVFVGRDKIAAVGVSISRAITGHGLALNVTTDLRGFSLIVPCGLTDHGVTSLERLVSPCPSTEEVAARLVACLRARLGQDLRIIP